MEKKVLPTVRTLGKKYTLRNMYPYGFGPEIWKCAITIILLLHRLNAEPIMKSHLQGTGQSWTHHQGVIKEIANQWCHMLYGEIWLKSCTSPTPALACA